MILKYQKKRECQRKDILLIHVNIWMKSKMTFNIIYGNKNIAVGEVRRER